MGKWVVKEEKKGPPWTAFYYSKNPKLVTDLGKGRSVSWSDGNVKQLEINPGLDRCGDIVQVVPLSNDIVDGAIVDSVGSWQPKLEFKKEMKGKAEKEMTSELVRRERIFKKMVESQEVKFHRQDNVSGVEVKADSDSTTKGDK